MAPVKLLYHIQSQQQKSIKLFNIKVDLTHIQAAILAIHGSPMFHFTQLLIINLFIYTIESHLVPRIACRNVAHVRA